MSKHVAARSKTGTALSAEDIQDFNTRLMQGSRALLRHPQLVRRLTPRNINKALSTLIPGGNYAEALGEWGAFYKKVFALNIDFSGIAIPEPQEGFERLIIIAQGITMNRAMQACKDRFPTWQYTNDLDKDVVKNDRTTEEWHYAIWVRNRIEADEEMKNLSANDLGTRSIKGITLLERILMELDYFERTSKHLDVENWTLCAGSRYSDGFVPSCYWYGGGFGVGWCRPGYSAPSLRARVVVS